MWLMLPTRKQRLYLCISSAREICGTIVLRFMNEDQAEIGLFSLHPDYQGQKLGPMFMSYVEQEAFKTVKEVILHVIPICQEHLVKFYEGLSYKTTGQTVLFSEKHTVTYIRPRISRANIHFYYE